MNTLLISISFIAITFSTIINNKKEMKPIISASEALKIENAIFVDARGGGDATARYNTSHVMNACYADLDKDLAKIENPANGGRHPLPSINEFSVTLGKMGITPSSHVIVYDDKGGANAAARFWWMIRAVGHEKVQVVSGGLDALIKAGAKTTSEIIKLNETKPYPVTKWISPIASFEEVEKTSLGKTDYTVIDVREGFRYRGESEPIDLVAGHIPNAINVPYIENLNADGTFKSSEELKEKYQSFAQGHPEKLIVHCGSGVTACHTLLALEQAGISGAQLYVGSWSEWSRRDKPIAKGN